MKAFLDPSGRTVRTNWINGETLCGDCACQREREIKWELLWKPLCTRQDEPSGRTGSLERHAGERLCQFELEITQESVWKPF